MKLKNIGKIVVSSVVAAALFLTAVSPAGVASASEAKTDYLKDVTAKKHLTYYSDNSNEYLVAKFDLKNHDDKITVKCSSKNLYAGITYKYHSYTKNSDGESGSGRVDISAIIKKAGNYNVTITEKTADGKTVFKKSVKLYCNTSFPVKKVTLNGKVKAYGVVKMKSAKFKVAMNKGYKLKKIQYGVFKKDASDMTWKTIKNGGKVVFGKYPRHYESKNEYGDKNSDYYSYYEGVSNALTAATSVKVTYVDKYTKSTEVVTYTYYRYLK